MTIEGVDTYLLIPRDPGSIEMLLDAVRPTPRADDVDVVIGLRGPIAPPEMANGLMVPIVLFDQIYSFDVDVLCESTTETSRDQRGEVPPHGRGSLCSNRATGGQCLARSTSTGH